MKFGIKVISILVLFIVIIFINQLQAQQPKRINVGYFEAGKYSVHSILRDEYFKQLEQILPEEYLMVTVPEGYRSAEWKRETCRDMAKQLSRIKHLDMVIAVGPWVVHDLLQAGFDKPILAMHQFNPYAENLLDSLGKPIAENLTVSQRQGKIFNDLTVLSKLKTIRRLGLLYFPSTDEKEKIYNQFRSIGERLGMEIVIGEGDDNFGTYAFFKAFHNLGKRVDAVYLGPMWGMDEIKISEFFKMLNQKRIPTFTYEGNILIDKGAFATNDYFGLITEARFNAVKTIDILQGKTPSSLPVILHTNNSLAVNLQSAAECHIDIPDEIINNFYTIESKPSEETSYYTLTDAVNRALMQNSGYLAETDALRAATHEAGRSKSEYMPQLYGKASYNYFSDETAANSYGVYDNKQFHSSLNLNQKVFSLETKNKIKLANNRKKYQKHNLIQTQLDLELGVALAYIEFLHNTEVVRVLMNNRKLTEINLELARAKNIYSDSDSLDIIRIENERYRNSLTIIEARGKLRNSRVKLNRLFNLPGDEPFELDRNFLSTQNMFIKESSFWERIKKSNNQKKISDKLLSYSLSNNPQIYQLETEIRIQNDLLNINKTRYFPEIGLKASLNYDDRLKKTSLYQEEKTTWEVGTYLSWPLFLGGDRGKTKNQFSAQLSEAEYQKDELSLQIMQQVQTEFNRLVASGNKLNPAYQSKQKANSALEIGLVRFTSDKISARDLLELQNLTLSADLTFINSRFEYYKSMARLINTAGVITGDNYSNFIEEFHRLVTD